MLLATPMRGLAISNTNNGIQSVDPITDPVYTIDALPFPDSQPIRIAIYFEPNLTTPAYDTSSGDISNNVTNLVDILSANPLIDATIVNVHDIYNHILNTATFDVFAIVDNNPRENITNMVTEFWLAGGGILAFDGTASFLNYAGILPIEAIGTDGYGVYWNYDTDEYDIVTRHPVSKAYSLATTIPTENTFYYCSWDWTALSGTAIAGDLIPIAQGSNPNDISVLAYDPSDRGGKVVSIGFDLNHEVISLLDELILDAVDWLVPKPKGKIVFDLTHKPRLGVDDWDTLATIPDYYYSMRDHLVSNGYTFDKLYPEVVGDNFTLGKLAPYDMLIVVAPDYGYSTGDKQAIEAWVSDGGTILAMTEAPFGSFEDPGIEMDSLLNPFGLSIVTGVAATATILDQIIHPTTEGCQFGIQLGSYGYINVTNDAYPIWYDGPNMNIVTAASEYGEGRVIYHSDINTFDINNLAAARNDYFIVSIANWLTAAKAKVLIYSDWLAFTDLTTSPLALALNDLGVKYQLTGDYTTPFFTYFNLSFTRENWDLIIIDNPSAGGITAYFDALSDYIDSGGHLIMSYYDVDQYSTNPFWAKLGFKYNESFTDEPPLYIWDTEHPIFNQPHDYGASSFVVGAPYTDDGDKLTVFPNATAIAGWTATEEDDNALIVLRNDERTLFNSYLIDEFDGDEDDSTYRDSFELWKNEIAFMLRPKLDVIISVPSSATLSNTIPIEAEITNVGLSDCPIGYLDITLPVGLSTTDDLSQSYNIPRGATEIISWAITSSVVNNYTISFEAIYRGYFGTEYSSGPLDFDLTINAAPPGLDIPWWYYVIGGGALLLIILIIVIAVSVSKKKRAGSTR